MDSVWLRSRFPHTENTVVNRIVVRRIAASPIRFFDLFAERMREERRRITCLFFTLRMEITAFARSPCDPSVLDPDDPVCCLGDLFIVGDHHDGLSELVARHFQET